MCLLLERHGHITAAPTPGMPIRDSFGKGFWAGLRAGVMYLALGQLTKQMMNNG